MLSDGRLTTVFHQSAFTPLFSPLSPFVPLVPFLPEACEDAFIQAFMPFVSCEMTHGRPTPAPIQDPSDPPLRCWIAETLKGQCSDDRRTEFLGVEWGSVS